MSRKSSKESVGKPARRRKRELVEADWGDVDGELIREVIEAITNFGGAVRFGRSRDGGAYALGIYGDGDTYTEHLGATDDVSAWLTTVRDDYR